MSFDLELTGRRTLVTAGTKGVGAAVVDVLHNAGATVIAAARAIPADSLTGVHYIAADMTTAAGCATVAQAVLDRLGGIDILVNVLGGSNAPAGGFAALDDEAWAKELDLNLMPAVRLDRALLPSMLCIPPPDRPFTECVSRNVLALIRSNQAASCPASRPERPDTGRCTNVINIEAPATQFPRGAQALSIRRRKDGWSDLT